MTARTPWQRFLLVMGGLMLVSGLVSTVLLFVGRPNGFNDYFGAVIQMLGAPMFLRAGLTDGNLFWLVPRKK